MGALLEQRKGLVVKKQLQKKETVYVLSGAELRGLQGVLLEMLLEVDRICRKHGIRYALIGGTLLGAVRHGGFIPWDDDLDITLLRGEYNKLREACKSELDPEKYFFQDHTTDPYYRWGYGRIRRKDSDFVRVGQDHMKMRHGIFIDLFPSDNIPDSPLLRPLHKFCCFALRKILYAETGAVTGKTAALRLWYRLLSRIPASFAFRCLEALATGTARRRTELVRTYTFPAPKGGYGGKRAWNEHFVEIEFEGQLFYAFDAYREYLEYKYGPDYMTLPPPEKRHTHPAVRFRLPGADSVSITPAE